MRCSATALWLQSTPGLLWNAKNLSREPESLLWEPRQLSGKQAWVMWEEGTRWGNR